MNLISSGVANYADQLICMKELIGVERIVSEDLVKLDELQSTFDDPNEEKQS